MTDTIPSIIDTYLLYCKTQKRLDEKTIKAYRIDLTQFSAFFQASNITSITVSDLESFIAHLNLSYKPKTVRRKIASVKAFFQHLEYKNIINLNPFNKMRISFREPLLLPKTIPMHTLERLLSTIYEKNSQAPSPHMKSRTLLDIAIIETLFSTGMRISELCNLKKENVNLLDGVIRIYGKGAKERLIQIGSKDVTGILTSYENKFSKEIQQSGFYFTNPNGTPVSDQAVRRMIKKYCSMANIEMHITPHMFRHTFATSLLEADVDIRYIQQMLGHSSITVTELYTHVALSKQKDILSTKHPRNGFKI